jgi:hypothetical protein
MLISSNRSPQVCQLAPAEAATLSHEQTHLNYWQIPWSREACRWFLFCTTLQRICILPTMFTFYSNISFPHVPGYIAFRFIWPTFCMHIYMLHVLPTSSLLFPLYWQHLLWPQIYVALCIGRNLQLCHFPSSWIPPSINRTAEVSTSSVLNLDTVPQGTFCNVSSYWLSNVLT